MDTRKALQANLDFGSRIAHAYLNDLSDAELLVRPVPAANHIAWQLGHLIRSTQAIVGQIDPQLLPPLPAGFADKYSKETAAIDDPKAFHSKEEYLRLMSIQREMLHTLFGRQADADLEKPAPESLRKHCKTLGDAMILLGSHTLMHAGQWAVVRRKLGKAITI